MPPKVATSKLLPPFQRKINFPQKQSQDILYYFGNNVYILNEKNSIICALMRQIILNVEINRFSINVSDSSAPRAGYQKP